MLATYLQSRMLQTIRSFQLMKMVSISDRSSSFESLIGLMKMSRTISRASRKFCSVDSSSMMTLARFVSTAAVATTATGAANERALCFRT